MMSGQDIAILLTIIVSIITILTIIGRWLKKPINELEEKVNKLEENVTLNRSMMKLDIDCGYRIFHGVFRDINPNVKDLIEKDLKLWESLYLCFMPIPPFATTESSIRLLPLGIKIIEELRTLKAYLDEDEHLTDIAEKEINQKIEDSEGSNVRLLSKLNLMTDILISKHTSNEEIKNASRILKQKNYTGNPFPVFTSAVLVYILNRCVEKRMLEENILNLVSEATEELTTFREQIGLGG